MLYVNRYVWRSDVAVEQGRVPDHLWYGVVDTDDGVEEVVSWDDIEKAVESDIDIEGVDTVYPSGSVLFIYPWLDKTAVSLLQVKTSTLYHTDVVVHDNHIVSIRWRSGELSSPPAIRLSNFGQYCDDCILYDNSDSENVSPCANVDGRSITLILDDKIRITPETFRVPNGGISVIGKGGLGVVLDLREMTNDNRAMTVYDSIYNYYGNPLDSVIDNPERIERVRRKWGGEK